MNQRPLGCSLPQLRIILWLQAGHRGREKTFHNQIGTKSTKNHKSGQLASKLVRLCQNLTGA